MSRIVKSSSSYPDNTYVEFRFENSLRKYEKKPSKKVKCEVVCHHCLDHHRKWHSPHKCLHKHGTSQPPSPSQACSHSNKSYRPRMPLIERKIYSSLIKEQKASNLSEQMDYSINLNDFEPSELVDHRQPDEDQQFGKIELKSHRKDRIHGQEGHLPKPYRTMQLIGSIPEMSEVSSTERVHKEQDKEMAPEKEFCFPQEQSFESPARPSAEKQEMDHNMSEIQIQQGIQVLPKEQQSAKQQSSVEKASLLKEDLLPKIYPAEQLPEEQAESPKNIASEGIRLQNGVPEEKEPQNFKQQKEQAIAESKQMEHSHMMVFEGSRIAISSPQNSFWLSARVLEKAVKDSKDLNSLMDWLLKARPYLSAHRQQLHAQILQKFGKQQK